MTSALPMRQTLLSVFQQSVPVDLDTDLSVPVDGRDCADGAQVITSASSPKLAKEGSWISRMFSKMSFKRSKNSGTNEEADNNREQISIPTQAEIPSSPERDARLKQLKEQLWQAIGEAEKAGFLILMRRDSTLARMHEQN
eukprot:CAMPEP_0181308952 /NCGR_PEP_ID=MMETSP1101-20121128/11754_1 /TAXON_ID=46948 /ORGANISM="Rhodomonas abbreviata, Strain Caron Lab Isolate" /LENGTH=140 /DNA_ID=CAMNT_0023415403 /DNA_START=23 /DNA_END=445 /DNA_ORIENTATION=-